MRSRQLVRLLHELAVEFREAKVKATGIQRAVEAERVD
jgi:hypothetical protein